MPTEARADPGRCRVTFRMNTSDGIDRAWVAGEFNGWSTDATPLERQTDGSLAADVVLETGKAYRYRFYLGRDRWENDWAADRYVDNDDGDADSVVVGRASSTRGPAPARTGRRRPRLRTTARPAELFPSGSSTPTSAEAGRHGRSAGSDVVVLLAPSPPDRTGAAWG